MGLFTTVAVAIACLSIGWATRPWLDATLGASSPAGVPNTNSTASVNNSTNSTSLPPALVNATVNLNHNALLCVHNTTRTKRKKRDLEMNSTLPFALVADLDRNSNRMKPHEWEWFSYLKVGQILWDGHQFDVQWIKKLDIVSSFNTRNRSMELSELTWWNGAYLAVCDYTGVLLKIRPTTGEAFPRFVLADGDGKTGRTLKGEWMTVYDGQLFIGGHGKEWTQDGKIVGRGAEWVKVIHPTGLIRSIHWINEYTAMRRATGTEFPGYLSHEAAVWNWYAQKWVFLPRKASKEPYDDLLDEHRGTNLLILCSEDFGNITVLTVGPLEPEWGFSSVALVPGSNGKYLIATKVHEVGDDHRTKLTIFDMEGRIMLTPEEFVEVENVKYEGVEFLGEHENW